MLGRLFKLRSLLGGGENTNSTQGQTQRGGLSDGTADFANFANFPSAHVTAPGIAAGSAVTSNSSADAHSYEDSYTREILYGSLELALHPLPFNPKRFRLVVSQDGGNLRTKQVLYDSAIDSNDAGLYPLRSPDASGSNVGTGSTLKPSARILMAANASRGVAAANTNAPAAKFTHNINDLNDYMFGRGLPSVERHTSTKIHMLPLLSLLVHGLYLAVLLTRLFLIADSTSSSTSFETPVTDDADWAPHATFPSKDSAFLVLLPSSKAVCPLQEEGLLPRPLLFSSRFAVAVVIPLEDPDETVEEVLSSNWQILSHYLIVLQRLVCKKLALALRASVTCYLSPFINNKRIMFPAGVLQQEAELAYHLQKLVKLVYYNVNIPRLVNINAFMTYSLGHMETKSKTNVINWALEVINWLEFKDGRNFSPFHSQGLAIPQMHSQNSYLLHSSSSITSWYRSNETSMSSNTFLASLLALIIPLKQLLSTPPLHVDPNNVSDSKCVTRIVVMTSNSSVAKKLIFILSGLIPDTDLQKRLEQDGKSNCRVNSGGQGTGNSAEDTILESEYSRSRPASSPRIQDRFQDKRTAESLHEGGISFTANSNAAKPIPIRSSLMASDTPSDDSVSVSVSSTKGWDVPQKSSTSLSLTGQKSPLEAASVTAAQQIPDSRRISVSNTSSMAYLSSSLNSSLSSSASNYSFSRLGSSFMDKWRNSLVGASKLPQNFISETIDGAITPESLSARPAFSTTNTSSPAEEIEEPTWENSPSGLSINSPARQKFSRTQSMLNLFNGPAAKSPGLSNSTLGIDRTRSSVYIPPLSGHGCNADDVNRSIIRGKVEILMQSKLKYHLKDQSMLEVDPVEFKASSHDVGVPPKKDVLGSKAEIKSLSGKLHKKSTLQPNVAFVDEFRPEYTIQSCPVNPRLEAQVANAMKNDLLFYQNNCGYEKVTSKTVFISLRAREIKLMEMTVGNQKRGQNERGLLTPVSPAAVAEGGNSYFSNMVPDSPRQSYFPGTEFASHEKREGQGSNSFRTTVKKVYTPNRNSGDKELIQKVEGQLEKLNEVASLINSNSAESAETKELYNRMLFNAVRELIT